MSLLDLSVFGDESVVADLLRAGHSAWSKTNCGIDGASTELFDWFASIGAPMDRDSYFDMARRLRESVVDDSTLAALMLEVKLDAACLRGDTHAADWFLDQVRQAVNTVWGAEGISVLEGLSPAVRCFTLVWVDKDDETLTVGSVDVEELTRELIEQRRDLTRIPATGHWLSARPYTKNEITKILAFAAKHRFLSAIDALGNLV